MKNLDVYGEEKTELAYNRRFPILQQQYTREGVCARDLAWNAFARDWVSADLREGGADAFLKQMYEEFLDTANREGTHFKMSLFEFKAHFYDEIDTIRETLTHRGAAVAARATSAILSAVLRIGASALFIVICLFVADLLGV